MNKQNTPGRVRRLGGWVVRSSGYKSYLSSASRSASPLLEGSRRILQGQAKARARTLCFTDIMHAGQFDSPSEFARAYQGKRLTALFLLLGFLWVLVSVGVANTVIVALIDALTLLILSFYYGLLSYQLWLGRQFWQRNTLKPADRRFIAWLSHATRDFVSLKELLPIGLGAQASSVRNRDAQPTRSASKARGS